MKMILLAVSVLLMVKPYGTMAQSSKHLSEVQSCSLTKSTLPLTKFSAFRASLREMEFSLKRLEDSLDPPEDSTYSPPQILKVRVQTTEDLLELTCSMKPSLKDSQLPSSKTYPAPAKTELKILENAMTETVGVKDESEFCKRLS